MHFLKTYIITYVEVTYIINNQLIIVKINCAIHYSQNMLQSYCKVKMPEVLGTSSILNTVLTGFPQPPYTARSIIIITVHKIVFQSMTNACISLGLYHLLTPVTLTLTG